MNVHSAGIAIVVRVVRLDSFHSCLVLMLFVLVCSCLYCKYKANILILQAFSRKISKKSAFFSFSPHFSAPFSAISDILDQSTSPTTLAFAFQIFDQSLLMYISVTRILSSM